MGGLGFRTFTAGEVLTASNVQNYLQDQAVMVFGGSAARSSAIGTANFAEGMVSYLKDTDKVEAYNGTNWVSVAPTSTQGLTLINTTSFSAVASQSVNDVFSATYDNYLILTNVTTTSAADKSVSMRLRVSGADNSTANYFERYVGYTDFNATDNFRNSSQTSWFILPIDSTRTDADYTSALQLRNPFGTMNTTHHQSIDGNVQASSAQVTYVGGGLFNATTSFTGFTLIASSGTITGNVRVYGYNQ